MISGFGAVYKAETTDHVMPITLVAVKVSLPRDAARSTEHHQHLTDAQMEEAGAPTSIPPHPHVVKVIGVEPKSRYGVLIVLPLAEGGSLRDWLEAKEEAGQAVSRSSRLKVLLGVALGLRHLHSLGLVHQDLKPGNVLMFEGEVAAVSDFGLVGGLRGGRSGRAGSEDEEGEEEAKSEAAAATAGAGGGGNPSMTASVTAHLGTPGYRSPEQEAGVHVTARSDVWSFGLVLTEVILHPSYIGGDWHDVPAIDRRSRAGTRLSEAALAAPESEAGWWRRVQSLALRCLSLRRRERPTSEEVVSELLALCESEGDAALAAWAREACAEASGDLKMQLTLGRARWFGGHGGDARLASKLYEEVIDSVAGTAEELSVRVEYCVSLGSMGETGRGLAALSAALSVAGEDVEERRKKVWQPVVGGSRDVCVIRAAVEGEVERPCQR